MKDKRKKRIDIEDNFNPKETIKNIDKKYYIFIGIGLVLLCTVFYLIFTLLSPKEEICTLTQKYNNYTNNIKVSIIKDKATITEVFKSKNKEILEYRSKQLKKDGYNTLFKNKNLVSTKIISGKGLKEEYLKYGYKCDNNSSKKFSVLLSLKNSVDKLEVKTDYNDEIGEAKVNSKNYLKKVIVDNTINNTVLGKYVVSFRIPISKYRFETLYQLVEVVDTTAPTITLKDSSPYYVNKGEDFNDPGVEVTDNYDDKAILKVISEGEVNTNENGTYKITYTVEDSSLNKASVERTVIVKDKETNTNGFTYVKGILIVNKKYSLPSNYAPGLLPETETAYNNLAAAARNEGYSIPLISGFRSYETQNTIYNNYISIYGQAATDTFSARPGHSEHQSGLAMDVGKIDDDYGNTPEGKWLALNAHRFGFIIRYPKGKEHITGYKYEPWHIRYLGVDTATKVYSSGLTLEEFLGI